MNPKLVRPLLIVGGGVLLLCLMLVALAVAARPTFDTVAPTGVGQIFLPNSMAAYNGVVTPATRLYAPWLLGSTSYLRVYNAGSSPATVRATWTYGAGVTVETVIPPGAVGDIETTMVPTATRFAAVVTATQPVVAVVNDLGPGGIYATSYAAMPAELGRTALVLPSVQYFGNETVSEIAVQNVGSLTTSVTIVYTQTGTSTPIHRTDSLAALGPGEVHIFRTDEAGLDSSSENMATIHSDQPVVAVVNTATYLAVGATFPERAYIYRAAFPGAGLERRTPLYFPFLARAFASWKESMIRLVNASSAGVTFSLQVGGDVFSGSIGAWAAQLYRQSVEAPSPPQQAVSGYVGDVTALEGLVWLNGQGSFINDFLAAYSAPGVGANVSFLPYADQSATFVTYVAVQNLSDETAAITMTQHTVTGTVGLQHDTLEGKEMHYYLGGRGIPSSFEGGVVIQANRPVAAVAIIAGQLELDQAVFMPLLSK